MTHLELRDHFAGKAIAGLVASLHSGINERQGLAEELSAAAYKLADAMIAERAKGLGSPAPRTEPIPGLPTGERAAF